MGLVSSDQAALCQGPAPSVSALVAQAVYTVGEMHGLWWLDDAGDVEVNATACLIHLLEFMPRRDTLTLFADLYRGIEFLSETVRASLRTWPRLAAAGVPWNIFLDGVLPYAVLNEKRDVEYHPRARLAQLFHTAWEGAATATDAMHNLSALIPTAVADYTNALVDAGGSSTPQLGSVFTWHSSVSPGYLSVQQVASAFGSCTGTAIVLVAAARAIGIPARLAGCSQTDVVNDECVAWAAGLRPSRAVSFSRLTLLLVLPP